MNKKLFGIIGLVAIICIVIVAARSTQHRGASSAEPIKIGQMSGLTGIGSDIGVEERNGALLAVEQINAAGGIAGRQIQMISEDAPPFDTKKGASVAEKLTSVDNVAAIIGPQWDSQGEVMAGFSANRKIPVVSQNVSTDIEAKISSPYFFVTWPDDEVGIIEVLKFAQKKGWKKIAIIEPANFSFWLFTANLMEKHAAEYGIQIVSKEMGSDFAVVDYRTLIAKTKAKKPDAFFGSFADLQCVFLKQTKEQGMELPFLSTDSAGNTKPLAECPGMMTRLYFSTLNHGNGYDTFTADYEKRFGHKPTASSAVTAYNAALVLGQVMKDLAKSGMEINRENIKNGLKDVKFTDSVSIDAILFNDKGYVITPADAYEIQTVKEGKFVKAE